MLVGGRNKGSSPVEMVHYFNNGLYTESHTHHHSWLLNRRDMNDKLFKTTKQSDCLALIW